MVVILLLTPYTTNGCDGGSNESSTESTTSTGETAILNADYKAHYTAQLPPHQHAEPPHFCHQIPQILPPPHRSSHRDNADFRTVVPTPYCNYNSQTASNNNWYYYAEPQPKPAWHAQNHLPTGSPTPPPLPKTEPPYESYYGGSSGNYAFYANAVPKPPRGQRYSTHPAYGPNGVNQVSFMEAEAAKEAPHPSHMPPPCNFPHQQLQHPHFAYATPNHLPHYGRPHRQSFNSKNFTNSTDYVRHVTRVNFYDIDTSQVEYEPKDDNDVCDTEAITKEEEWITKRKTELTTTRQIETRVKRQVVLEDGKVVEDSGPIVSTNTTEDTDKQETETTEKRDLGIPEDAILTTTQGALLEDTVDAPAAQSQQLVKLGDGGKAIKKMVARPADGLVREIDEKRVVSHEEKKDYLETEDVHHLGDFSDEFYVKAVNSGTEHLQEVLLSPESQQQLVPLGPRVVANTSKSFKTIDSEDTKKRSLAQEDGTIVTEHRKTTEHEVIVDRDLPEKDDRSTGSREKIETIEATQRHYKQRDEQHVDLVANGKVVDTEMRYAAETMQIEKDGSLERPGDWDSLSDRIRKQRRNHHKTLLQQHKAALLADRKDALTKRPLDFDREEETRKGETMKWLESHFGSESTASNDSRDDDAEIEPTKKTYFNVTIKSNQAQTTAATNGIRPLNTYERKQTKEHEPTAVNGRPKFYQGISNWTERKEASTNHFATKAFREDLQETVERNRLKRNGMATSRDRLNDGRYLVEPSDSYVTREDIMHQKRQSLSSQFLAKSKHSSSRDKLDELDTLPKQREALRNVSTSRTDLRYGMSMQDTKASKHNGITTNVNIAPTIKKSEYLNGRSKSYERELDTNGPNSPEIDHLQSSHTLGRPTVPQRRRAIEKKLLQQHSSKPTPLKVPFDQQYRDLTEPPPDYSPPPRSRSSSPTPHGHVDYSPHPRSNMAPSGAYQAQADSSNTLTRKQNQRTRFAPTAPSVAYNPPRPMVATQTTQTTPSTISNSTATSHKSSKVGQAIGNSIRKLVSKIRSASAERKLRRKSKSKSREQSPSPPTPDKPGTIPTSTTYQQYNLIDSHIEGHSHSNESEVENTQHESNTLRKKDAPPYDMGLTKRESHQTFKRANSADPFTNERERDADKPAGGPRQRYYLGEDPYSSNLYGKQNQTHYIPDTMTRQYRNNRDNGDFGYVQRNNHESKLNRREEVDLQPQRQVSSNTLGRYQKSNQRFAGSTPNLNQDYRTIQTLPRKLNDHSQQSHQQYQKSTTQRYITGGYSTLGHPEKRTHYQSPAPVAGPAKPARTYAKVLNRSKSFNVHAINGSNDPSPIYIEKLTKNNYTNNLQASQAYKSNPHLYSSNNDPSLLKSPSIVNLISRSQKDLTKIGTRDDEPDAYVGHKSLDHSSRHEERKQVFLKGLYQDAPDLYKTQHGDDVYSSKPPVKYQLQPKHSLDSRSPIEINKDTASIIRRGSSSNDEYVSTHSYARSGELTRNKRILLYKDDPRRRGSGSTIIEVRNADTRK